VSRNKSLTSIASRRVVNIEDYRISLTIEPIKFLVGSIDSLGLNLIIKVFLLVLYMSYENITTQCPNLEISCVIILQLHMIMQFYSIDISNINDCNNIMMHLNNDEYVILLHYMINNHITFLHITLHLKIHIK